MQFLVGFLFDMTGFVIRDADVFANRRFHVHVRDRVFDAVVRGSYVVIAA